MMKGYRSNNIMRNSRGNVLPIVLIFIGIIALNTVALSSIMQRDVVLVQRVRNTERARFMAEAGINDALARIKANGFSSRSNFTGNLDTGSYSVTHSETGGRYLVVSVGTVNETTSTVSAELYDNTPTALNYFSAAGNDVRINSLVALAQIVGDIHGNNNVYLKSGPLVAWLLITGDVSAVGIVKEGTEYDQGSGDWWDNHVVINGDADDTATVYEGEDRVTFPTFDYMGYQELAVDSGDYYNSDQVFNGVNFMPANGIVYVDGDAEFRGTCTINGGIVADSITVVGTLNVNKAGTRNVVIAKNGDIRVFGRLYTEEALVYALQDIASLQVLADIDINGIMMARRDINMWNFLTLVDYTYAYIAPSDMMGEDGEATYRLVSWNQ